MKLLGFPYLVQKEILQAMCLYEAFALSTVSEKSRRLVRCCISHQQFRIVHHLRFGIQISRKSDDKEKDGVMLYFRSCSRSLSETYPYQYWRLLGERDVPVKTVFWRGKHPAIHSYWWSVEEKQVIKMQQYVLDLLPKCNTTLDFYDGDEEALVEALKVGDVEEVHAGHLTIRNDRMVKALLSKCGHVKKLIIRYQIESDFRFNYRTLARYTLDHLYIRDSSWVTGYHLLRLFIDCKEVFLMHGDYLKDEDTAAFLKKWMQGSRLEHFMYGEPEIESYTVTKAVVDFPGAVEVRKAKVWDKSEFEDYEFEAGECYMIQRTDGTQAIVCRTYRGVIFTTRFEIKKDFDQQQPRLV